MRNMRNVVSLGGLRSHLSSLKRLSFIGYRYLHKKISLQCLIFILQNILTVIFIWQNLSGGSNANTVEEVGEERSGRLCFVALLSLHESLMFATLYFDLSLREDGHPRPLATQLSRVGKSCD